MIIVVMGVSGAGKSTLGQALAAQLSWDFIEGDDYHPAANIEKMRAGQPLNDADRQPWLLRLQQLIERYALGSMDMVLACSALKQSYRESLGRSGADIRFVYLSGDAGLIRERLKARMRHFMLPDLLDSQVATLEPPPEAVRVPLHLSTDEQVTLVRRTLDI